MNPLKKFNPCGTKDLLQNKILEKFKFRRESYTTNTLLNRAEK